MNNMLIAQSGGPTAAINASLSGAIQEAIRSKEIDGVYGALNGIQGVLAGTIIDLRSQFSRQEDFYEEMFGCGRLSKRFCRWFLGICQSC